MLIILLKFDTTTVIFNSYMIPKSFTEFYVRHYIVSNFYDYMGTYDVVAVICKGVLL